MNIVKISIIIPYYKKSFFILDTINSILKQTFNNFEIIIVDDENSDESNQLLKKILRLDSRIRLLTNEKNIGAGQSRNKALNFAVGEFIAFCDSDDLWKNEKLEMQMEFMKKNKADFSFTSYEIVDEENKHLAHRSSKTLLNYNDLLNSCDIGLSTVVLKKNIFDDTNLRFADLKTKEDYVLWLKIAKKGIKIHGLNKTLTSWRKTNNSLSSSIFQKLLDGYRVYKIYMNFNYLYSFFYLSKLSINYILKKYK